MTQGKLEVICGSMFSGKTNELLNRLKRAEYAKKDVITIKHQVDNRWSYSCIVTHDGIERDARTITSCEEGLDALQQLTRQGADVVGIDEIQFFPEWTVGVIEEMVACGIRVIAAGLDMDYRRQPFGIVPDLMAIADEVTKLRAICMKCGEEANFTQRLHDGLPATHDEQTVVVGGKECYEARCRNCYEIGAAVTV
ncbi:MAG: thymidine kinase [Chlamydiales bacterium]|nr:thymidine kinase [Chlamydiia bacterium]MCP5508273.1 thymidine kinase [Chlamydiales bacterium]